MTHPSELTATTGEEREAFLAAMRYYATQYAYLLLLEGNISITRPENAEHRAVVVQAYTDRVVKAGEDVIKRYDDIVERWRGALHQQ